MGPLEGIPMDDMNKVFETNFYGTVRMIKEVIPDMKKRRGGQIIVVSSVMGLQGEQAQRCEGRRGVVCLSAPCCWNGGWMRGWMEVWTYE